MNVMPIPNELLGDNITLITPTGSGFSETLIANVRVERTENIDGYSTNDPRARAGITVWVDRQNSTWTDFPIGARVKLDTEIYEIVEQKVYRAGKPHHCKFRAIKIGDERL